MSYHIWPEHYPEQCPPNSAEPVNGTIYRFINRNTPQEKDFYSHYERNPDKDWSNNECNSRGLSVLKTKEACSEMASAVPALRKKKIVKGTLDDTCGVIAPTPSDSSVGHNTFWSLIEPNILVTKFSIYEEGK